MYEGKICWSSVISVTKGTLSAVNWRKGNFKNTLLFDVAPVLLTIQSSTASAKQNWSVWGNIYTKLRNKLKTSTSEEMATVYHNLRLIKPTEIGNNSEESSEEFDCEHEDD